MPCGGVFPCAAPPDARGTRCFFCQRTGCRHFYEEFDTFCHARCFLTDLARFPGGEARLALDHGHEIVLDTTLEQVAA